MGASCRLRCAVVGGGCNSALSVALDLTLFEGDVCIDFLFWLKGTAAGRSADRQAFYGLGWMRVGSSIGRELSGRLNSTRVSGSTGRDLFRGLGGTAADRSIGGQASRGLCWTMVG